MCVISLYMYRIQIPDMAIILRSELDINVRVNPHLQIIKYDDDMTYKSHILYFCPCFPLPACKSFQKQVFNYIICIGNIF